METEHDSLGAKPSQVPAMFAAGMLIVFGILLVYLAFLGYQSHQGLCAFKSDLIIRRESGHAFLKMTPKERERQFGKQLAHIPEATIRSQLQQQDRTIQSLQSLHCGGWLP